jgi:hypothetical protein
MEEKAQPNRHKSTQANHKAAQHVYVLRDLKEYLGESLLIIFGVLLALF